MTFTPDQTAELGKPLKREHVATRKGGGGQLSYIEGWHAIAEANRIFGFDGWTSETAHMECVSMEGTISYIAKVRVTIDGITREGWGAGHGRAGNIGEKHESAVKEAETDARKRALMTFGNQFGLALYDKDQANVEGSKATTPARKTEPSAEYKRTAKVIKEEVQSGPFYTWKTRIQNLGPGSNWAEIEVMIRKAKNVQGADLNFTENQQAELLDLLAKTKKKALAAAS